MRFPCEQPGACAPLRIALRGAEWRSGVRFKPGVTELYQTVDRCVEEEAEPEGRILELISNPTLTYGMLYDTNVELEDIGMAYALLLYCNQAQEFDQFFMAAAEIPSSFRFQTNAAEDCPELQFKRKTDDKPPNGCEEQDMLS
ncbi:unnamed protein product [Pleuronectes platessa]|uniref:Uncharacterized protein n=1 Tax=Pleuronectes platessa TaxID=8262 RepID=A0A9N7TXI2_PLEPL|nr:unnamed protein product [Pleuronectes platessa]